MTDPTETRQSRLIRDKFGDRIGEAHREDTAANSSRTGKGKPVAPWLHERLSDAHLEAYNDFISSPTADTRAVKAITTIKDSGPRSVQGLRVRLGKNRISFYFFREHSVRNKRSTTCRLLGHFPHMNVTQARSAALQIAGRVAGGEIEIGKRKAQRFDAALDDYILHLRAVADGKGKAPAWAIKVEAIARKHLRPTFGSWSLIDMANSPLVIRDHHLELTKSSGPVLANQAAKIIRATYKHAARLDISLPERSPVSGVRMNTERPRDTGITDFAAWGSAWSKIENPVRASYAMLALLTGARPSELAALRWGDVKPKARSIVLRNAKAGADIVIPMSFEIAKALHIARRAGPKEVTPSDFVFPARAGGHLTKFAGDGLPAHGNSLRHNFRNVCLELGINEILVRLLLGHSLRGVSEGYISRSITSGGASLRRAQAQISRRIMTLLALDSAAKPLAPVRAAA